MPIYNKAKALGVYIIDGNDIKNRLVTERLIEIVEDRYVWKDEPEYKRLIKKKKSRPRTAISINLFCKKLFLPPQAERLCRADQRQAQALQPAGRSVQYGCLNHRGLCRRIGSARRGEHHTRLFAELNRALRAAVQNIQADEISAVRVGPFGDTLAAELSVERPENNIKLGARL